MQLCESDEIIEPQQRRRRCRGDRHYNRPFTHGTPKNNPLRTSRFMLARSCMLYRFLTQSTCTRRWWQTLQFSKVLFTGYILHFQTFPSSGCLILCAAMFRCCHYAYIFRSKYQYAYIFRSKCFVGSNRFIRKQKKSFERWQDYYIQRFLGETQSNTLGINLIEGYPLGSIGTMASEASDHMRD